MRFHTGWTQSRRPRRLWPSGKINDQFRTRVSHKKCSYFSISWFWNEIVDFCNRQLWVESGHSLKPPK
jgi:hypothetical protein